MSQGSDTPTYVLQDCPTQAMLGCRCHQRVRRTGAVKESNLLRASA
jgi:hypothetical protein